MKRTRQQGGIFLAITHGKIFDLHSKKIVDLDCSHLPAPILGAWLNPTGQFCADGSRFAAAVRVKEKKEILIWDTRSGKLVNAFPAPAETGYRCLALSADGAKLAYAENEQILTVCEVDSGKQLPLHRQEQDKINELCFTPDGKSLLTLHGFQQPPCIRQFDLATGTPARKLTMPQQPLEAISASHDGRLLAVGMGKSVLLWDLSKGQVVYDFSLPSTAVHAQSAMSLDGRLLAVFDVSGVNNSIQVYDTGTGELKQTLEGQYLQAAFSPDDSLLAAGGADGTVSIWHLGDKTAATPVRGLHGTVTEIAFCPDGTQLAWICYDPQQDFSHPMPNYHGGSQLTVWNFTADTRITREAGKEFHFTNLAFSPNGQWVMATRTGASPRSTVCCWETVTGKPLLSLAQPAGELIRFARFTPDNTQLIGESNGKLLCWDFPSGKLQHTVKISEAPVRNMLLAGNDTLVTSDDDHNGISLQPVNSLLRGTPANAYATLYNFYQNTWLAVSSQGYFDCAPAASKLFSWRYQGESYPYEKFEQEYHQPELLRKALAEGETPHSER